MEVVTQPSTTIWPGAKKPTREELWKFVQLRTRFYDFWKNPLKTKRTPEAQVLSSIASGPIPYYL